MAVHALFIRFFIQLRRGGAVLFGLLWLTTAAHGQAHLAGVVTDSLSQQPLAAVTVSLTGQQSATTTTDAAGGYTFTRLRPGRYTVTFSQVGRRTVRHSLALRGAGATLNQALAPVAAVLGEVVVEEAPGRERREISNLRRQAFPVTVIDGQQIAGRASSLNEILNRQAGVKIRQNGGLGNAAQVNIRGLEGRRVQVYVDGMPLTTPDGSFNLNDLPTQFIERIEVYKGIVPPELGGDGLGGAINIVTIHPETNYLDAGYSVGSFNTHTATGVYKQVLADKGVEIGIGGGLNYADNDYRMESPYTPGLIIQRRNDQYRNAYGAAAVTFTKAWFDEAKLELLHYDNDKGFQGIQSNIRYARSRNQLWILAPELVKKGFIWPKLDFRLNAFLQQARSSVIDTSTYLYDFDNQRYANTGRGEIGFIPNLSRDRLAEARNRLNLKYHLSNRLALNLNNDFRYSRRHAHDPVADAFITANLNPAAHDLSRQTARLTTAVTSLALESTWLGGRLGNTTALRHYYLSSSGAFVNLFFGTSFTPEPTRLQRGFLGGNTAFRYDLNDRLLVKASVERNYRLPQAQEVYGDGLLTTANPLLRPEQGLNYSAGLLFDNYYPRSRRVQVEVSAFALHLRDMVRLTSNGTTFGYQNLDRARILGAEAEAKIDLNAHWYVFGNVTYQDVRDQLRYQPGTTVASPTYGLRVPNIPYFYFNHGVEYRHANPLGRAGQSVRLYQESSYTQRYYYGYQLSALQDRDIPTNYVHTAGFEYTWARPGLSISGEVQNLTNQLVINNFNTPLPGRSFRLKLRFTRVGKPANTPPVP